MGYHVYESCSTVEPRLLRRLGHIKYDAIFEVDAIFEGRSVSNLYFAKRFRTFLVKCDVCNKIFQKNGWFWPFAFAFYNHFWYFNLVFSKCKLMYRHFWRQNSTNWLKYPKFWEILIIFWPQLGQKCMIFTWKVRRNFRGQEILIWRNFWRYFTK